MYNGVYRLAALLVLTGLTACRGPQPNDDRDAWTTLRVWSHQGQEAENRAMQGIADAFNRAYADEYIRVDLEFFPDYQYTEKLSISAAARDLPDVFDLDGPTVAQFADAGLLASLPALLPDLPLDDFLPTILEQGRYRGSLYALGAFDSALVLYYDREQFRQAGVRPPPAHTAWTWSEFTDACDTLSRNGFQPVSLHMDISADEWFTYAFTPLIWSAGGRLISEEGQRAAGILDHPSNVRALENWQQLFSSGWALRAPTDPDPFGSGKTAMDWSGHWMARSHLAAKGDRLGVMPLPRTGPETAAACGSWCWAISSETRHPDAAVLWMKWVLDPETGIRPIVQANGAVPGRRSAFALFPGYQQPPFSTFRYLQENHGRPRPRTPVYPTLTRSFAAALRDIAGGAAPSDRLNRAAEEVQRFLDRKTGPQS